MMIFKTHFLWLDGLKGQRLDTLCGKLKKNPVTLHNVKFKIMSESLSFFIFFLSAIKIIAFLNNSFYKRSNKK